MASSEVSLLVQELNKLTKPVLIELIVYKKVPANIKCCDIVKKHMCKSYKVSETPKDNDHEKFHDSQDFTECLKSKCVQISTELESYKRESNLLKQLIHHLEKRTSELEEIITLLKLNNTSTNHNNKMVAPSNYSHQKSSVDKTTEPLHSIMNAVPTGNVDINIDINKQQKTYLENKPIKYINKDTKNVAISQPQKITAAQVSDGIKKAEQSIFRNDRDRTGYKPRNYKKPVIGSNNSNNINVKTVPKKGYLHVYRCDAGTTPNEILGCLKETAPHITFGCEILKQGEKTTSFKVDFPIQHHREVYAPDIWPEGAAVRRFNFPRQQNFRQQASTTITTPTLAAVDTSATIV